jgi:mRNA interferase MazF
LPPHVYISGFGLAFTSIALCEQSTLIDVFNLRKKIGSISDEVMEKVERALMIQFGLSA